MHILKSQTEDFTQAQQPLGCFRVCIEAKGDQRAVLMEPNEDSVDLRMRPLCPHVRYVNAYIIFLRALDNHPLLFVSLGCEFHYILTSQTQGAIDVHYLEVRDAQEDTLASSPPLWAV